MRPMRIFKAPPGLMMGATESEHELAHYARPSSPNALCGAALKMIGARLPACSICHRCRTLVDSPRPGGGVGESLRRKAKRRKR